MTAVNGVDTVSCLEIAETSAGGLTIANRYVVLAVTTSIGLVDRRREHELEDYLHRSIWNVDTEADSDSSEDHICRPSDCRCVDIDYSKETSPNGANDRAENHEWNLINHNFSAVLH